MRRQAMLLCACLLTGAGCVTGHSAVTDAMKADAALPKRSSAPPVTADRVTPQNAGKQAQALWDELDRDTQENLATSAVAPEHK